MMKQLLKRDKYGISAGKILGTSGRRIPSVENFTVQNKGINKILEWIGLKLARPRAMKYTLLRSNKMNKYMFHQIGRLKKAAKNNKSELFGTIAYSLMANSTAFRISAITKVLPHGFFNIELSEVLKINRKVSRIVRKGDSEAMSFRVYLEEPKKGRPLAPPAIEGRIVLHMGTNMLQIFLMKEILPSQHGFIPGRGTLSCGKEVIDSVLKAKFIYECDLKKFFDRLKLSSIQYDLTRYGVPEKIVRYLDAINKRTPKLPKDMKIDESRVIDKENCGRAIRRLEPIRSDSSLIKYFIKNKQDIRESLLPYFDYYVKEVNTAAKEYKAKGKEEPKREAIPKSEQESLTSDFPIHLSKFGFRGLKKFIIYNDTPEKLRSEEDNDTILKAMAFLGQMRKHEAEAFGTEPESLGDFGTGVVQGFPTSPFLAIMIMKNFLTQNPKVESVSYADDPIFYSDEDFTINDDPIRGIEINKEKSGGIKRNGKGLTSLKFLGLRYIPEINMLIGETRSGTKGRVPEEFKELGDCIRYSNSDDFTQDIAARNIFGFMQACLYGGSGTNKTYPPGETVIKKKSLGGMSKESGDNCNILIANNKTIRAIQETEVNFKTDCNRSSAASLTLMRILGSIKEKHATLYNKGDLKFHKDRITEL